MFQRAKNWGIPVYNRPWLLMPIPSEWQLEGDRLVLKKVEYKRIDVEGMHSLENMPFRFIEAMNEYDEWEWRESQPDE